MDARIRLDQFAHLSDFKTISPVLHISQWKLHQSILPSRYATKITVEGTQEVELTSKAFCIWPLPKIPRSPPLEALEQSDSVDAIFANSSLN